MKNNAILHVYFVICLLLLGFIALSSMENTARTVHVDTVSEVAKEIDEMEAYLSDTDNLSPTLVKRTKQILSLNSAKYSKVGLNEFFAYLESYVDKQAIFGSELKEAKKNDMYIRANAAYFAAQDAHTAAHAAFGRWLASLRITNNKPFARFMSLFR